MKRKLILSGVVAISLALLWFVAVDWSWFVETCPDCGYLKEISQYRVFTIPIRERVQEDSTVIQRVAHDLGVACQHPHHDHWHKHRWWGLCLCRFPCINGIYRLTDDDSWYTAEVSAKLADLARQDPTLPTQFAQKVLKDHDYGFTRTILYRAGVQRDEPSDSDSAAPVVSPCPQAEEQ